LQETTSNQQIRGIHTKEWQNPLSPISQHGQKYLYVNIEPETIFAPFS